MEEGEEGRRDSATEGKGEGSRGSQGQQCSSGAAQSDRPGPSPYAIVAGLAERRLWGSRLSWAHRGLFPHDVGFSLLESAHTVARSELIMPFRWLNLSAPTVMPTGPPRFY